MKIGIIVYSQTGNTYTVAQKLKEKLEADGHTANIERVTSSGKTSTETTVDQYDFLVFGAPTHAFSLAPPMTAYLHQLPPLQNKKISCFVTKRLPFYWTGGSRAVAGIKKICEAKGATVCGTQIVVWSPSRYTQNINRCIDGLSSQISSLAPHSKC